MPLDFNSAEQQRMPGLIPKGTVVPVHMTLRPGGHGEGGWLKQSRTGEVLMLDAEFTVIDGQFARRKFWSVLTVQGETDKQKQAADISRSRLRAILEGARGIRPDDESQDAARGRQIESYAELDGIRFLAVVGEEPARDTFDAKNTLAAIITPDRKDWVKLEQVQRTGSATRAPVAANTQAPAASTSGKPAWAS
jgi:hypothetical protein